MTIGTDLQAESARARSLIPPAHLTEFDAVLAHARESHHGWTTLWRSPSRTQRRPTSALGDMDGEALRIVTRETAPKSGAAQGSASRGSTIRALGRFGLLDWVEPTLGA